MGEAMVAELRKDIVELRERVAKIEGLLVELSKRIDDVNHSLSKRIDDLRDTMSKRIDDLRDTMRTWFIIITVLMTFLTTVALPLIIVLLRYLKLVP